jgi:hypothetical protein
MTVARIYQPAKTAMQSGKAKTAFWILEFNANEARFKDPVMGWTGTTDTLGQLNLRFSTVDAAISFAQRHGIDFIVEPLNPRKQQIRSYSDNFAYNKTT